MTSLRKRDHNANINMTSAEPSQPQPCQTIKALTIRQALDQKLPWPWEGKVLIARLDELTKELFVELEAYGLKRRWIQQQFGVKHDATFYAHLKRISVATKSEAAMATSTEIRESKVKPPIDVIKRRPKQTEADIDAKLQEIEERLAAALAEPAPHSPEAAENIPENIPVEAEKPQSTAADEFTAADDEPIPFSVTAADEFTAADDEPIPFSVTEPGESGNDTPEIANDEPESIDLDGWELFVGGWNNREHGGNFVSVGTKIYIGSRIDAVKDWERAVVLVKPGGHQIALRRSNAGVKIQTDKHQRHRAMVCSSAAARIVALVGKNRRYQLVAAKPDVCVFALIEEEQAS